jgi:hypothetical protein
MPRKHFTAVDGLYPLYSRYIPVPQDEFTPPNDFGINSNTKYIDLTDIHLSPFGNSNSVDEAVRLFDARAARAIRAGVESASFGAADFMDLLEFKPHGGDTNSDSEVPDVRILNANALPLMAIPDYFPNSESFVFGEVVSEAIMAAGAGWCGTFGPGVHGAWDLLNLDPLPEGNYDISQMHLLQIAYLYFDDLSPEAREHLITVLLASGRVNRINEDDVVTSGGAPNDWSRVGYISPVGFHVRIGETENHILMIHTVRYLTNQLLYQRDHDPNHDNRRNNSDNSPTCMGLMLLLLRNFLRDDFSEYNAKSYQTETRYALLNLCSYAYDHEVRLAARMVLDYISAHLAVSSNDLRRMVPFRRRNDAKNSARDDRGVMQISLLETTWGADPMASQFAMLAGNTRIYATTTDGKDPVRDGGGFRASWHIKTDGSDGNDAIMYALSEYRLPLPIHDLFVNDSHRRFFQRLHRTIKPDVESGQNCDNTEIYAGSPSYLISAGGEFATWSVDPGPVSLSSKLRQKADQQLGVAMPTSFMATTRPSLDCGDPTHASDLIQFGRFTDVAGVYNYGVAPDFVCGPEVHLPDWCTQAIADNHIKHPNDSFGSFEFVDRGSTAVDPPGFYLALLRDGDFAVMEAWDTWLHPNLTFEQFKSLVYATNRGLIERGLQNNIEDQYMTLNGNVIHFTIWNFKDNYGARVRSIDYGDGDPLDSPGDASQSPARLLNGTVINSLDEAIVEITNHFLNMSIKLDMSDPARPKRTSKTET